MELTGEWLRDLSALGLLGILLVGGYVVVLRPVVGAWLTGYLAKEEAERKRVVNQDALMQELVRGYGEEREEYSARLEEMVKMGVVANGKLAEALDGVCVEMKELRRGQRREAERVIQAVGGPRSRGAEVGEGG